MSQSAILATLGLFVLCFFSNCSERAPVQPVSPGVTPEATGGPGPVSTDGPRQLTDGEKKQLIDDVMKVRAKQQAEGLGTGEVKVNGAWNYTGYSYLSPDPAAAIEARLVAVDVTISGHTPFFDIDDIEIVDGITLISYGSDPQAGFLKLDGTLMGKGELPAGAPEPGRWLLIYAFPKNTARFHLYYWGKQLTRKPVEIGSGGLSLPYPRKE